MNKITNPKTEVPKGPLLNDKDYSNLLLTLLKDMVKNYTVALTEASNEHLFSIYNNMFEDVKDLQRETFELMFRNGWYELSEVEASLIDIKYNTLKEDFDNLSI